MAGACCLTIKSIPSGASSCTAHLSGCQRFGALRSLSELQFGDDACRYRVPCQVKGAPDHDKVLTKARIIYEKATQGIAEIESRCGADEDYSAPTSAKL